MLITTARFKMARTAAKSKVKTRVTAAHIKQHRENSKKDFSPKWDGCEDWSTDQFSRHFRHAMEYYRLEADSKSYKPSVINWMSKNGYSKDDIALFKKTKDWRVSSTMGAIASCLLRGMQSCRADFNNGKDSSLWLGQQISKVITDGKNDIDPEEVKETKPTVATPSIQDRTRDAAYAMTDELEDALEAFYEDKDAWDPKAFKVLNLLRGKGVKAAHARIIKDYYSNSLNELKELASGKADEQLKEGYKHLARKYVKKLIDFYTEIDSACTMLMEEAKVTRKPRAKKAVSKDKLVEKLKFLKSFEQLKLVSVNPADIIGSKELWVYNTKTRKLGKYISGEFSELGVKGTSITGFDEIKSIQKTLRKPIEQIAAFKSAGKVALRKFLDEINAVDTKLNGRISEDVVLLKVV
jgi:hypothetical protein